MVDRFACRPDGKLLVLKQIELLDRQKWKTRVELASAIFDYIQIFFNRQRRHSALGYRTPIEYELSFTNGTLTAVS